MTVAQANGACFDPWSPEPKHGQFSQFKRIYIIAARHIVTTRLLWGPETNALSVRLKTSVCRRPRWWEKYGNKIRLARDFKIGTSSWCSFLAQGNFTRVIDVPLYSNIPGSICSLQARMLIREEMQTKCVFSSAFCDGNGQHRNVRQAITRGLHDHRILFLLFNPPFYFTSSAKKKREKNRDCSKY